MQKKEKEEDSFHGEEKPWPLNLADTVHNGGLKPRPQSIFTNVQSFCEREVFVLDDVTYQLTVVESASKRSEGALVEVRF